MTMTATARRLTAAVLAALGAVQLVALWPALAPGAWGTDMSLHLAETAGLSRSLAAGDPHLWNDSANLGFPSAYYYQALPQLLTAAVHVVLGGAISIVTLFSASLALPFVLLPAACWRAARLAGARNAEALGVAVAVTLVASVNTWGFGLDSTLTRGLYTQAWAMLFYPLALVHAWRYLTGGRGLAAATGHALLCGLCHPFIAICLAPALLLTPWWRGGIRLALGRAFALAGAVLATSAFFWLPILVTYDHFGGFPNRGNSEQGMAVGALAGALAGGDLLDAGRLPLLGVLVLVAAGLALVRRHRLAAVLLVQGAGFGALIALGPALGPTEGDLLPAIRFLAPMQLALAAAAGVAAGWLARRAIVAVRCRLGVRVAGGALAAAAIAGVVVSGMLVRDRTEQQLGPYRGHHARSADDLERIAAVLRILPTGRVATSELYGISHRNHWWYYLPAVYAGHPVLRGYGAGALQSSPSYRYLYGRDDVRLERHARLYGIRYLLATTRWRPRVPLVTLARSGQFVLYHVPGAGLVEPARITRHFRGGDPEPAVRRWLTDRGPSALALLAFGGPTAPDGAAAIVHDVRRAPSRIEIDVEVAADGGRVATLLVKESFHPGWTATIDGEPARVIRVAPALMAVQVPAGAHQVRLEFRRPGWSFLLLAGSLLLLVSLSSIPTRWRGRPGVPPSPGLR